MRVWGRALSGVQGHSHWSGGQGGKAPWSWKLFCISTTQELDSFPKICFFCTTKHFVRRLGCHQPMSGDTVQVFCGPTACMYVYQSNLWGAQSHVPFSAGTATFELMPLTATECFNLCKSKLLLFLIHVYHRQHKCNTWQHEVNVVYYVLITV